MSRRALLPAIAVLTAALAATIAASTPKPHSLHAIDCVIVNVGSGPTHQSFEICPPITQ